MNIKRNILSNAVFLKKLLPIALFIAFVIVNTIFIVDENALIPLGLVLGSVIIVTTLRSPMAAAIILLAGRIVVDLSMSSDGSGLSIGSMFSIGCTGLACWHTRLYFKQVRTHVLFPPLLILLALVTIASLNAATMKEAFSISLKLFLPFIIFFAFLTNIKNKDHAFKVILLLGVISLIAVGSTFYHWSSGQLEKQVFKGYGRLTGGYSSHRNHALSLFLFIFIYISLAFRVGLGKFRYFFFVCLGFSLFFLYHTHTRSAQLVTILALLSALVALKRWIVLSSLGVALGIAILNSETIQDRFKDLVLVFNVENIEWDTVKDLGSGRYLMWSRAVPTYFEQPPFNIIFGLGSGKHTLLSQRIYDPFSDLSEDSEIQYTIDTHNSVLFLLFQFGPLSIIVYAYILWKTLMIGRWLVQNGKTDWERIFGAVIIALVVGFASNDSISNGFVDRTSLNVLLWPVFAVAYKLKELSEADVTDNQFRDVRVIGSA